MMPCRKGVGERFERKRDEAFHNVIRHSRGPVLNARSRRGRYWMGISQRFMGKLWRMAKWEGYGPS